MKKLLLLFFVVILTGCQDNVYNHIKSYIDSLKIIEDSIQTAEKFMKMAKPRNYNERHHNDLMTIDFHVIESGIESLNQI